MKKKIDEMDFEKALNRLEEISKIIENKDISLEESIGLYEEGMSLYAFCHKTLDDTKGKITIYKDNLEVDF